MNTCKLCNEEAKPDEWADHDKKICINCESDNDGYFNTKNIDEPKETNQQQETDGIIKWQNVKTQALNELRLRNDQVFIPRVQTKVLS